jgi:dsRNA-specific ribonuclease
MASKPVPEEDLTAAVAAYVKHGGLRSAARALNLHHATLYDSNPHACAALRFPTPAPLQTARVGRKWI